VVACVVVVVGTVVVVEVAASWVASGALLVVGVVAGTPDEEGPAVRVVGVPAAGTAGAAPDPLLRGTGAPLGAVVICEASEPSTTATVVEPDAVVSEAAGVLDDGCSSRLAAIVDDAIEAVDR
jgi:hypothetical protein